MSSPRHRVLTAAASSVLALMGLTAPAAVAAPSAPARSAADAARAAAFPTNPFDVTYGATYTRGTLTWTDRAVGVSGNQRAVSTSGCRKTFVYTYDASVRELGVRSSSAVCNGVAPIAFSVPADVAGGAAFVSVCLTDGAGAPLKCEAYARSDATGAASR
ncbi:hypothetical protein ACFYRY_24505 [Streptomyces sp. NPDC005263]|uniref:hypothetical protein n=1 Tax=Streptomyces sp. NPDC005263 TaxID=3364711 RepID=UPI0036C30683